MEALSQAAAELFAGLGAFALLLSPLLGRAWRRGIHMALDLWIAAGVLNLAGDATWSEIAAAATIIAIRQLITVRLRFSETMRSP